MSNLRCFYEEDGKLLGVPGCHVKEAILEAISLSGQRREPVRFEFNGVRFCVEYRSSLDLLMRDFHRGMAGYHSDEVGPYPPCFLSDEAKARDAEIEAQNQERRAKADAEYQERERQKRATLAALLANAPAFDCAAPDKWQAGREKNQDSYGAAIFNYAETWARLMQARLAQGEALSAVAEETSFQADVDGLTGFMYGCAVSILSDCWRHGEELRRWHNLKTQINGEGERANETGGVLNPALLTVGAPDAS